jgi:hypothetical protein
VWTRQIQLLHPASHPETYRGYSWILANEDAKWHHLSEFGLGKSLNALDIFWLYANSTQLLFS